MATTLRLDHNSYSTNGSGGAVPGDAASGHLQRLFISEWMDALEPYNTELLTQIKRGSTINQRKIEWGQSSQTPHRATLSGAMTSGQTTLPLTAGHGSYTQQWHVFKILEDSANNAPEIGIITATAGDAPVILRGQSGTTAVAHGADAVVEFIGVAEPQLQNHPKFFLNYGDISFNYTQRFATGLAFDAEARVTPNYEIEGDQLVRQMKIKGMDLKLLLEKAIIHGGRQAGDPSTPLPSTFGGMQTFITTNVRDLDNAPLSLYDVEQQTANVWDANGFTGQTLLMNMKTKRIISRLLGPHREGTFKDSSIDLTLKKMTLDTGDYTFTVSRYVPDGFIFGVDTSGMRLHAFKNLDWHVKAHETDGDYDWHSVSGTFSFSLGKEKQMFIIKDFDTTLANYPTMAI